MGQVQVRRRGEGTVSRGAAWLFKISGRETDGMFDFMVGEVPYCSGPPLHVHAEQYDTFYVLAGTLTVQAGDELINLEPGDFVTVPPGIPHTFDNVHLEQVPVEVINLMVPGGSIDYFDERAQLLQELGPEGDPSYVARCHGITQVGPSLRTKLGLG